MREWEVAAGTLLSPSLGFQQALGRQEHCYLPPAPHSPTLASAAASHPRLIRLQTRQLSLCCGGAVPESLGPNTSALARGARHTNLSVEQIIHLGVETRH